MNSLQHIQHKGAYALTGGQRHFFLRGMDIIHIGTYGNHVHFRNLLAEQTAFESGMDADDLPFLAKTSTAGFLVNRLNFRIRSEIPSGIAASVTDIESAHSST